MATVQSLPPPIWLRATRPMGPSVDTAAVSDAVVQQLLWVHDTVLGGLLPRSRAGDRGLRADSAQRQDPG